MSVEDSTDPGAESKSTFERILHRIGSPWRGDAATSGGLLATVLIAWGVELLFGLSTQGFPSGLRVFCILWFASGAAFFVGTIMGFVFGMPKTRSSSEAELAAGPQLRDNTNLQEISDWLTKIVIGLGIAEFRKIAAVLMAIGTAVGQAISNDGDGTVMALGSMTVGFVCGFLFHYMWARVILHQMLEKLEGKPGSSAAQSEVH